MRVRVMTVVAGAMLFGGVVAWVRSYLPDYWTLRAHRGSLVLLFFGTDAATHIDPANNPSLEETYGGTKISGKPPRRWDTEQTLHHVRWWAEPSASVTTPPVSWRALGFELVANRTKLSQGYFLLAAPFWAMCLPLAGATAFGLLRWRRQRRWRAAGRCRNCGYDLRASSGACPECGTHIVAASHAVDISTSRADG